MTNAQILGTLSTLMLLFSRANYLNTIFRGRTRPHAFSWLIWGVISSIGFTAQVTEGAGAGSWSVGFGSFLCYVIFVIALFKGERYIRRGDWIILGVALSAIPLWVMTKTPVWSVALVCMIDTLGYFPTLRKSWDKPHEETAVTYALSSLCSLFALLAVEHYTVSTWLYPAVLILSNGFTGAFLMLRRRMIRQHE
ncbi:MAG: hypothetical protein V1721_04820 [Pseudomonadota bacterium]